MNTDASGASTSSVGADLTVGTSKAGTAPSAASARMPKTGETVPSPEARTGAKTKVTSLSVAPIPSARGSFSDGVSSLSTARRYPKAAPVTAPANAENAISHRKGAE